MQSGKAMNRLIQGDVGSGKTLVAAALIWYTWKNGFSSAFMAPTEILAQQHFDTLSSFLAPFGMRLGKLTGAMTAKQKREVKAQLKNGEIDLIIGTHALFPRMLSTAVSASSLPTSSTASALISAPRSSPRVTVLTSLSCPRRPSRELWR